VAESLWDLESRSEGGVVVVAAVIVVSTIEVE